MIRGRRIESLALVACAAVFCALPFVLTGFQSFQLALVAVYLLALVGLDLLTGFSGQISLGHGAFMAIGAYTSAVVVHDHPGVHVLFTIPLAGAVAGAAGLLFGLPALRLSGLYLALVTFGLAVSVPQIAQRFRGFLGGSGGLTLPLPQAPFGWGVSANVWLYALCWALAAVGLLVAWLLTRGRFGRALRAGRDSELAAVAAGIDLAATKTAAFGISAAYAGVSGSLFAIANAYVSPTSFPVMLSALLVVGVVVGGLGSIWGLVAGAVLIEFLGSWAQSVTSSPGGPSIVFGLVVVLVAVLAPGGAAGLPARVARLLGEEPAERL